MKKKNAKTGKRTGQEKETQNIKGLLTEGRKYHDPMKHNEFICPLCGGVAAIYQYGGRAKAECYACGRWIEDDY